MCGFSACILIGASSLMVACGFTIPGPARVPSIDAARALMVNDNDDFGPAGPSMVAAASAGTASSWYENASSDPHVADDDTIAAMKVDAAAAASPWYENALLDPQYADDDTITDRQDADDGTIAGMNNQLDGPSTVAAAATPWSWYENALFDPQYTGDVVIVETNEQFDIFDDEELKELCAIDRSFDIGEIVAEKRPMKRRPKKHKHLFRYSPDISVACWLATVTNRELLESCGFTEDDIKRMTLEFPRLLKMDAKNLIAPKLRFLVNVLGAGSGDIGNGVADDVPNGEEFAPHNLRVSDHARGRLPAKLYFGARLETAIGPRHAYLALHKGTLPHGKELLGHTTLLDQFLDCCSKKPSDFARLCNRWQFDNVANRPANANHLSRHTAETVRAMDSAFSNGLATFARNEATLDIKTLGCTPADMVSLLLDHGANYAEHDDWGATALHWAAGTGNLDGIKALIEKLQRDEEDMEGDVRDVLWSTCASCYSTKDMATPLHWAAAGANRTHFGCGGHVEVCRFLLSEAGDKKTSLANSVTAQGNTPFMWACWSGSLDVAELLVGEGGANPFARNKDGFTAAHWAASAGHVSVCEFLQGLGMSFVGEDAETKQGQTPLDCAKSHGRSEVVEWVVKQELRP